MMPHLKNRFDVWRGLGLFAFVLFAVGCRGTENVQFTVYDGADHITTGAMPYIISSGLYDWLWQQTLTNEGD